MTLSCRSLDVNDLPSLCATAVETFAMTPIHSALADSISTQMHALFGEKYDEKYFAVRSSAFGK